MNKKLLSGIMSGLMLASSCSAVGAEAPKGIKDRIINSVVKHKKLILTGAAIHAVADGAMIWLLTHNNNIKMDYSKFKDSDDFGREFVKAAKAFRKSLTVSNIKGSDARDLESKINNEATDKKTEKTEKNEKTEKIVTEGINELKDDVQGTLVLEKTKKSDGISIIKFKFIENEKAEEIKEEKKEENESQETEVTEDKKENESQETEVNEDKKENESQETEVNEDKKENQGTKVNENQEEKDKEDNSEKDSDKE